MRRFAELPAAYIAIACATWFAFVVLLPRLMLLAMLLRFRLQALLSPAKNHGGAFGGAHWTSWQAMVFAATVPPALLLGAWMLTRFVHRGAAP